VTFEELLNELYARGFNYLDQDAAGQARAERWINEAYLELCDLRAWPFLLTTATGVSPLTISDVGKVLYVVDTTNETVLRPMDKRSLVDNDPALDDTGNPDSWYLDDETTLTVHPPDTSVSLSVRYARVPSELSDDDDEPVVPSRFQYLIVDGAVIKAYKDSDNFLAASALRAEYERGIQAMETAMFHRNFSGPEFIVVTQDF
jgi:hypothetical protein